MKKTHQTTKTEGGRDSQNFLGEVLYRARIEQDMTQDEFGAKYGVTGPAVFKFEKGYVRPSLKLWLAMAEDAGLLERRAVLLWIKSRLPQSYRHYVDFLLTPSGKTKKGKATDYALYETREKMRAAARKDTKLPKGLRDLVGDKDVWEQYKPTGHEINLMRDLFGPLGKGGKAAYCEALRLIREFTHSF
jgi:DNA-binding XRE family transcriptional regulator